MSARQLFAWGRLRGGSQEIRNCPLPDADPVGGERREHEPEGSAHDAGESKGASVVGQTAKRIGVQIRRAWTSPVFWEHASSACFLLALGVCLLVLFAIDGGVSP